MTATAPSPAPVAARDAFAGDTQRVLLPAVSWSTFEALLADKGDERVPRLAYDRGALEIVSPGPEHEQNTNAVALFVEIVAAEWGIDLVAVGSMTYKRATRRRGFEPDASFYVANAGHIRGRRKIDPEADPPPDLVVEIDASRSSLDKLALYAAFGVTEVWRIDDGRVSIALLTEGGYGPSATSRALPGLAAGDIERFLAARWETPSPEWYRGVGAWARQSAGERAERGG